MWNSLKLRNSLLRIHVDNLSRHLLEKRLFSKKCLDKLSTWMRRRESRSLSEFHIAANKKKCFEMLTRQNTHVQKSCPFWVDRQISAPWLYLFYLLWNSSVIKEPLPTCIPTLSLCHHPELNKFPFQFLQFLLFCNSPFLPFFLFQFPFLIFSLSFLFMVHYFISFFLFSL